MEAILNANLPCSNIGNHLRNEERVELRPLIFVLSIIGYLVLERLDASNSDTENHTNAV